MVVRTLIGLLAACLWMSNALAHPFSQEEYSLRTAVTISDKGIVPLVVLEIPIPIALKEIGANVEDHTEVKRRKIKAYNNQQWNALANSLTFTVDGTPLSGEWLAIDHPANGKATEGFFVYMVSFMFDTVPTFDDDVTVEIVNSAFMDSPMVYSGSATTKEPWMVEMSTSKTILGDNESADLTDPLRWSKDAALRTMTVVARKSQ